VGLEADGLTIASHLTLVAVLGVLAVRAIRSERDTMLGQRALAHGLTLAIGLACAAVAVERVFYTLARLLRAQGGVNLYGLHPAPEMLGGLLIVAFYGVSVPFLAAGRPGGLAAAGGRVGAEVLGLAAFWGLTAWVLW
jgi:hypothetical protein